MKRDPARALPAKDLTDADRQALLAGDVGALFRMGANAFLMAYMARFEVCGLSESCQGTKSLRSSPLRGGKSRRASSLSRGRR
jgi:hypothetical protein